MHPRVNHECKDGEGDFKRVGRREHGWWMARSNCVDYPLDFSKSDRGGNRPAGEIRLHGA